MRRGRAREQERASVTAAGDAGGGHTD
jgi:hypothetical protein